MAGSPFDLSVVLPQAVSRVRAEPDVRGALVIGATEEVNKKAHPSHVHLFTIRAHLTLADNVKDTHSLTKRCSISSMRDQLTNLKSY